MIEKHVHEFTDIGIKRIYRVQPKYNGTSGDKAFLVRMCRCGKLEPFDFGGYKKMLSKLQHELA